MTTPATQPHCEHECVCSRYYDPEWDTEKDTKPCCIDANCEHDTRSRPTHAAPEEPYLGCKEKDPQQYNAYLAQLRNIKEHDTTIRNATLKPFQDLIENESKRNSNTEPNMVYSYRVAQIIESLRTKEQP